MQTNINQYKPCKPRLGMAKTLNQHIILHFISFFFDYRFCQNMKTKRNSHEQKIIIQEMFVHN